MVQAYEQILARLPGQIRKVLPGSGEGIQELRLTAGAPAAGLVEAKTVIWGSAPLSFHDLEQALWGLCDHALPAYERQLALGYLTVDGCRVGVSGQLRYQGDQIQGYSALQSLNIRIPYDRFLPMPQPVIRYIESPAPEGILIAGPPGSGKTTFLLGLGQYLAHTRRRTVVVDEKQELIRLLELESPFVAGFSGCRRADGILYGLRGCNPEFILCDEIATVQDVQAIRQGLGAGVRFVATMHAQGLEQLQRRLPFASLQPGCFGLAVLLGTRPGSGCQAVRL